MYYPRKNPHLYNAPLSSDLLLTHEKVEELLEAHLMDTDSLGAKLNYLLVTLQNAEASVSTPDLTSMLNRPLLKRIMSILRCTRQVSLKLDVAQDKIMLANTKLSVAMVIITFAAYWTGEYPAALYELKQCHYL